MVVQRLPLMGSGGVSSPSPDTERAEQEVELVGDEKKDVIIEVLGDIGR